MWPLYDENRPRRKPIVNYTLIAINVAVFIYFYFQGYTAFQKAIIQYGEIPIYILKGERLYTLITSMFMHGGWMHLIGNMVYLYIFGDNVEDAFGHLGYLAFYIIAGLGASLVHLLSLFLMPPDLLYYSLRVPAVGASGAISGVLGAYMILYPRARIRTLVVYYVITIISIPAYYYIGFWFLYQLLMGMLAIEIPSGVAFWAHVGGFVTGVLIVKLLGIRPPRRRKIIYYYHIPVEPYY
ncbi:MAG TPA: rhomboid family intramembrane serine protease [Thermofilum sp.]|nr:rhomboid family intramembrane serine protease [Thermofilum sp.]